MELEAITTSPSVDDFTLLSQHQEETPVTFFGGRPVLHLHSPDAKIRISREDLESQPALAALGPGATNGEDTDQVEIENIDVWASSRFLTLYSTTKSCGVQIAYQTITVHAQEGSAVYLGLNFSDANTADEDIVFVQLRILPIKIEAHHAPTENHQPNGDSSSSQDPAKALFKAIADCQELNPDPPQEGDDDYDETAPGATGWITSDNMQDFVDENGEFRMPEGVTVVGGEDEGVGEERLGEGAGRTRTAAEIDGEGREDDATKWQRTD